MKIGRSVGPDSVPAFTYSAWEAVTFDNGRRCIKAREVDDPIGLLIRYLQYRNKPVSFLYVLIVSRANQELGRYESPSMPMEYGVAFLNRFGKFFAGDGRHEIWIRFEDGDQVVYDRHERIWFYGDLERSKNLLESSGILEGQLEPIPVPHDHWYNAEFDDDEREILRFLDWFRTPLYEFDGD